MRVRQLDLPNRITHTCAGVFPPSLREKDNVSQYGRGAGKCCKRLTALLH